MTDAIRPEDDLDEILESIELDGTLDSGDSIASPADVQAAKSDAKTPAGLSEPDVVHNIEDLESILYDFGRNPGLAKQEPPPLAGGMDAVAEAETVEAAVGPVDDQQEESDSQGYGEKAMPTATGLGDPFSAKQNSAARPSGKLPLFGLLLGLLGIAAGLGAGYYTYLLQGKLAVPDQRDEATVQAPPPAEGAPAEAARQHSRVGEGATLIQEYKNIHDSSGEEIDSLKSRIVKTDQEIGGLRDEAADRGPATEVQIPSPTSAVRISSVPPVSKGSWAVNLESHSSGKAAAAEVMRLRSQGIDAEIYAHIKDAKIWYRIRVPGFSSSAEARAYAENVLVKAGVSRSWISRMQ